MWCRKRILDWLNKMTASARNLHLSTPQLTTADHFKAERHLYSTLNFKLNRAAALTEWRQLFSI
jgi:hypothetical protein